MKTYKKESLLNWKAPVALAGLGLLGTIAQAQVVMNPLWRVSTTNGLTYLNTDGTQRGLAYNPVTDRIYVVSRTGSPQVYKFDAFTGAEAGQLDVTGVTGGGGGAINLVDVADDGSIYICNLATSANTFRLYRYTDESAVPQLVFLGDPSLLDTNAVVSNSKRFGDNMSVRGSGTNVQVLVNSRGGRASALLFPSDSELTNFLAQTIHTDANNGDLGLGAAFGAGNTFWGKAGARNLRQLSISNPESLYDTNVALVATSIVNTNVLPNTTAGIGTLASSNLLALLDFANHTVRLYNTSSGNPEFQDSKNSAGGTLAGGFNSNANGTGVPEFGTKTGTNYVWVLDSNNGVAAYAILPVSAPIISASPANATILEGGYGAISVVANGTAPLTYRWFQIDTNTATTNLVATVVNNGALSFINITATNGGGYQVVVSNASGTATSDLAVLTVAPTVRTSKAAKLWQLPAGSRSYLTADGSQRGIAYHAPSNLVAVVNRSGTIGIRLLNADTGADAGQLDMTGVIDQAGALGGFALNMIGIAEDGAVYACNLTTAGGGFTIYRWADADPATVPTIAYGPDNPLGERVGDAMAVGGSGVNTRIYVPSRSGTNVAVFTTFDGSFYTANTVVVDAVAGFAGLGIAAGAGDTFWAKSGGEFLRKVAYDLVNATNEVQAVINGAGGANIAVDTANDFVATISSGDTPSNLRLSDVRDLSSDAILFDQEFFGSDNPNINNVGSLVFDVTGGRIFALDSNNGIIALKYGPRIKQNGNVVTWTGPGALQAAGVVTGTYTNVSGAVSPYSAPAGGTSFYRVER
jgi:hypothetical protein